MNRTGEHRVAVKENELARSQGIPCGHLVWDHSTRGGMRQAWAAPVPG